MFNALHFQEWWHDLPQKSVIVRDRATYHLVPEEQIMPTAMRKHE
jgi:heat shock protein HspQ